MYINPLIINTSLRWISAAICIYILRVNWLTFEVVDYHWNGWDPCCVTVGPDAVRTVWWESGGGCVSCLSGNLSPAHCLTPARPFLCFPSSPLPLLVHCFLTHLPFILAFYLPLPSLSSVCSRVMVCCGLPTQRNNISGVGKVQPHMSCAAEGRLCEVGPIPHGSYSSQPRDQRPAIPLRPPLPPPPLTSWFSSL